MKHNKDVLGVTDNVTRMANVDLPALKSTLPPAVTVVPSALQNSPCSSDLHQSNTEEDLALSRKIESFKEKQRADSFFNSLTSDQAYQVSTWILEIESISEVWRKVTAPPPEGLGLKVARLTLRRLRDAWRAEDQATIVNSTLDVIHDMEQKTDFQQSARMHSTMNFMLSQTAFELMWKEPASPLLKEILGNIRTLTDLELKREKLRIERERLLAMSTSAQHQRPPTPSGDAQQSVQHHRVDLNIVPLNSTASRQPVVIQSEPQSPGS